jgi:hypothetical protein
MTNHMSTTGYSVPQALILLTASKHYRLKYKPYSSQYNTHFFLNTYKDGILQNYGV